VLSLRPLPSFIDDSKTSAAWTSCWESLLRMPIEPVSADALFEQAKRLVKTCCARNGHDDWFEWRVDDGHLFVSEQLALDPDSPEWQRIDAVLTGALAGLAG
jgi:hypothetical protein